MFLQILELTTRRLPDIQAIAADWAQRTTGRRTAVRTTTTRDVGRPDTYLLIVEFPDAESARANSDLPETDGFARTLRTLVDGEVRYRDLDVLDVVSHTSTRRTIDCRETPNVVGCTLAISGEPDELVAAAAQHAVTVHGHHDDAQLHDLLRGSLRSGV
jgi:Protein of unknown function (DUF1059)